MVWSPRSVASTSPADFDEMWLKINKLVTLVYPQYTAGKTLTTSPAGDYRFTQPFSQLVSASPIVRIRLGDLLRSNYSRFALARLFGLGSAGLKLDGTDITPRDRPANYADKLAAAKKQGDIQVVILDTAGRLHIDDELMEQLKRIDRQCGPDQVLLVVDGKIDPVLSETFGFDEVGRSHQLMHENKHAPGNMAILVNAKRSGLKNLAES